ncbi:MAG TPA: SMP-30/gluconolactonase/LRE family protein [Puia sp.]|nr:SMP-30/gluconolactonase/LRE family protein [Puia sp.]
MEAQLLVHPNCLLGESPVWDAERNCCYWVDIEGKTIFEYWWEEGRVHRYPLDQRVSMVVPGKNNHLIVGLETGVGRYSIREQRLGLVTDLGIPWNNLRCNDGKCDPLGRLWIGTMDLDHKTGGGNVYCIDEGQVLCKIEKVSISNGMAWSPDNKHLFYTDSPTRKIVSYSYDPSSGTISFPKTAIEIPEKLGMPDGMAMDEEGQLWVALWGGFGVARFDSNTGELITFIKIPVPNVTSCSFAGKNLDRLVITTARKGLSEETLKQYPASGGVFIADPGVKGTAAFTCRF